MRIMPRTIVLSLMMVVLTMAVFLPVAGHDFLNFDDNVYLTENPQVRAGLTREGVAWALTTGWTFGGHPLTWLSHQLDVSLFGLRPGWHHLVSALLHTANALLLFLLLRWLTGSLWAPLLTAALFAVHPLHVESVAWAAERKDVLAGLFWMLTMGAYLRWLRRPGAGRYLLLLLSFALGLMAKAMLVTLPLVLLLLDWWPLGRWGVAQGPAASLPGGGPAPPIGRALPAGGRLLREKAPLLLLAVASSVVASIATHRGGAVLSLDRYPFPFRLANALVSYAAYLAKTVWPSRLNVYYLMPHPGWGAGRLAAAAGLLLAMTAAAVFHHRLHPYLIVGWLWYLGTLVPVIGLVQVGEQARADRYTYLPLIGVFIMIAWSGAGLSARLPSFRPALACAAGLVVLALAGVAYRQVGYWKDSSTLFTRALEITPDNWLARGNLGAYHYLRGEMVEALPHLREVVSLRPALPKARYYYGNVLYEQGRIGEALDQYEEAIRLQPGYAEALVNRGMALGRLGRAAEAFLSLQRAVALKPDYPRAHLALGDLFSAQGRMTEAVAAYRRALALNPRHAEAHNNLGAAFLSLGAMEEARASFAEAVRQKPDFVMARVNLGAVLERQGRTAEARQQYVEALRNKPDDPAVLERLARLGGTAGEGGR